MESMEERRRLVRRLIGRTGRGLAETLGFNVSNNPSNLFQLLCLAVMLRNVEDYRLAAQGLRALRDRGLDSAARMARSSYEERWRVLQENGLGRRSGGLAAALGDLAPVVLHRYGGDLRRLRTTAKQDGQRERELLRELPGVDDGVVDLYFREVQAPWREIAPFADRRALRAARTLDLGRSAEELADITGGVESEKLAWLVGALARVDMDNTYDEVRPLARA